MKSQQKMIERAMILMFVLTVPALGSGQNPPPPASPESPSVTLANLFVAACRQDTAKFSDFLTTMNAAHFRNLPPEQQLAFVRRVVQVQDAGKPLVSPADGGSMLVQCETPGFTLQIRLGAPRIDQNLAFVNVEVAPGRKTDFGMVLGNGGWKLISIGVLMLDLPQLEKGWAAQDMESREGEAMAAMRKMAAAIILYRAAFNKMPDSLAQLGPAPKEGISPDAAGLLDADLAAGRGAGYTVRYRVLPAGENEKESKFELAATPNAYGKTGVRSFVLDAVGRMRGADKQGAPANSADPIINNESSSVH
jgi:hypothetical protein